MRSTSALVLIVLGGCWNGADALHKPCENDDQCGRGQTCNSGFCDGPPNDTTLAGTTSGSDGCGAPGPETCEPVMVRELVATPQPGEFVNPSAIVAGDFVGDSQIDVAVLNFGNRLLLFENAGAFALADDYYPEEGTTEIYDLAVADLDGDGEVEFVMLSHLNIVEVVNWENGNLSLIETFPLGTAQDLFSFVAADVVGDERPDLVVAGSTEVFIVPNIGGRLEGSAATSVPGEFHEPWDTLVVGTGSDTRILIPESNDLSVEGVTNQSVHVIRVDGSMPVLGTPLATNFRNPWAVAEGDFIGGDELEIAVAEKNLNVAPGDEGSTIAGSLRFFRLAGDEVMELPRLEIIGIGPGVLAAGDLDCDGKTDLVIGNGGSPDQYDGQPQVLFGSCEPSASAENLMTITELGGTGINAGTRMAIADFDGDGLDEVAIPDFGRSFEDPGNRIVFLGVEEAQ